MTVILDAGALVALDRNDREFATLVKNEYEAGRTPVTHGGVVGQVWRDTSGRQANLARALKGITVRPLDESAGRAAGELLSASRTDDVIDAAVVLLASEGDEIYTSDPADLHQLANAADVEVDIVPL